MIKGISLFSNVGLAETYLKDVGVDIVIANELIEKRARFYKHLYPECEVVNGDITDATVFDSIVSRAKELGVEFLIATPPCQGMSIAGLMNPYDERNSLVKYAIDAIQAIKPKFVLLENVPRQMVTPICPVAYLWPTAVTSVPSRLMFIATMLLLLPTCVSVVRVAQVSVNGQFTIHNSQLTMNN